jgi:hypothetical protein
MPHVASGSRALLCKQAASWAAADSAQWQLIYFFYFPNIFKSLQIKKFVLDSFELGKL